MTARGSRGIFSTPDAVTDLRDYGDRLDNLERVPASTTPSLVDGYAYELEHPGDGSNLLCGILRFPMGFSKMDVAAFFQSVDETPLGSAWIRFEGDFETANLIAGGFTSGTPIGSSWIAAGYGLVRCSGPKRVRYYVSAQTSPPGVHVLTRGALFVTPVRSVTTP